MICETRYGMLAEDHIMPNEASIQALDTFRVPTTKVEKLADIKLRERLVGKKIDHEKSKVRKMW